MKRIFTILSLCFIFHTVDAQLADGSIVQNMQMTDLDGNTFELYDILNEGKSVIIDVFATWCGPCWNYHNAGNLKDIWDMYGPNGTDEMFVIAVEGDGSTPLDAIYGTAGNTIGDWTVGVEYPVVNSASIANTLNINYFPTIYMVCQDRTIREVGQAGVAELYEANNTCAKPVGENNGSLSKFKGHDVSVCGDYAYQPRITINNNGNAILSTATIETSINGSVVSTFDFTGELYPFDFQEVTLPEVTIAPGDELSINLATINGEMDDESSDNSFTSSIEIPAETVSDVLNVEIQTDDNGHEIYWRIIKPSGSKLADGGNLFVGITGGGGQNIPAGGYDDNVLEQETVELNEDGCYRFVIVDNGGDGLTGDGYYKVTDASGNILVEGTDFGARLDRTIEVNYFVNTNDIEGLSAAVVFPNPTSSSITIDMNITKGMTADLQLFDMTGKVMQTQTLGQLSTGQHQFNLSLANYANGIYFVGIVTENGTYKEKVVKM